MGHKHHSRSPKKHNMFFAIIAIVGILLFLLGGLNVVGFQEGAFIPLKPAMLLMGAGFTLILFVHIFGYED